MSNLGAAKSTLARVHRSHQVTGRAKKKFFFRRENDPYPSTPIPCGYAEHIGTSWEHTTDLRCSLFTFFSILGPAVGCSPPGLRASGTARHGKSEAAAFMPACLAMRPLLWRPPAVIWLSPPIKCCYGLGGDVKIDGFWRRLDIYYYVRSKDLAKRAGRKLRNYLEMDQELWGTCGKLTRRRSGRKSSNCLRIV